ncbi:enterochelin esterase-like enzyme [Lewinella marina]|uniref:Esterase n=1 Tax=Neolewinella marina TaxID=438751 RepID=A0A2G0CDG2_9BACT|nr:alpha/beta hydrolase-fold protein [Neolewinella marina]NJB86040.1 enterochelin esterase-like enzyme [Neolewinella marina]PHK97995.1 esterase [Neolewinella marina]
MKPLSFFRQLAGSLLSRRRGLLRRTYTLHSTHLGREVRLDVYRPSVPPWRLLSLVIFNDGQDLEKMNLKKRLSKLYRKGNLPATLVVGVHAGDRMQEYGTAGRRDHAGNGAAAPAYEKFITLELIPWLEDHYNLYHGPERRSIAGFSLGGLNAFDLAWRNPQHFRTAGVFSGSLWYRHKAFNPKLPDAHRIVHDYVAKRKKKTISNRFWFMAGTADETEDRNQNGVIDSIDDTLQLMALLREKGLEVGRDMAYVEVEGGRHEPETWGEVVGDFLSWALHR